MNILENPPAARAGGYPPPRRPTAPAPAGAAGAAAGARKETVENELSQRRGNPFGLLPSHPTHVARK